MPRKNVNALRQGNAPRSTPAPARDDFRTGWNRLVSNVAGTGWEASAQVAAQRADSERIPQNSPRWYQRATEIYREITRPAHV
jgi:hypothetical protein